jgi:hypothetical protein
VKGVRDMIQDTNDLLINLGIRVVKAEAREKALIKLLLDKNLFTTEELNKAVNETFEVIKKDSLKDLLNLTEEEYEELVNGDQIA